MTSRTAPLVAALAAVLAGLLAPAPALAARSAVDQHATPLPAGRWVTSALGTAGTSAKFSFRVTARADFLLTLGGDPAPYRLVLRDACGRAAAVSDRGSNQIEEIQRRLPPGRYTAEVTSARPLRPGELARLLLRRIPRRLSILDSHTGSAAGVSTITGQLLNNSRAWRAEPRVTAHIVLPGGRGGGVYTALAAQSALAPGQRGSFRIVTPPLPPGATYRLTAAAGWRGPAAAPTLEPDAPYLAAGGRVRYAGRVTGRVGQTVHVHVLRFNRIGALVDSGQAIVAVVPAVGPAHYEIDLPAYPYVSTERVLTG